MKTIFSAAKIGLASAFLTALTGCTTYVVQPSPPPTATVYTPPPVAPPEPEPVYVPPAPAPAVVVIQSDDDFYAPLGSYGQWVDVDGFGRCWRPGGVEVGWQPYTSGHWELTDQGWYWDSDEPWGWATYHYGRWEATPDYGWVWVPAVQWAPAWVTWREGGGYIGWAPLPPEPRPGIVIDVTVRPAAFCFVEERRMHDPVRPTTVIINNTTIINKTVNITKTKIVNNVVINDGPRVDVIEHASGRGIQKVSVNDLRHRDEQPVADRHPNLRARETTPVRQPVEKKPEQQQPRPENVRIDRRESPQTRPVEQNMPRETERPARKQPARPELVTTPAQSNPHAQPVSAVPQRERQPGENRNNQEQMQREQNPPPPAREARPAERPQTQPDVRQRERQPRPEETRAQQHERERPAARPETQRNEQGAANGRNAERAKPRGRESAGTNATENGNEGGRR